MTTQSALPGSYSNKVLRWGVYMYTKAKVKACCAWSSWMVAQGAPRPKEFVQSALCWTVPSWATHVTQCQDMEGCCCLYSRPALQRLSCGSQTLLHGEVFPWLPDQTHSEHNLGQSWVVWDVKAGNHAPAEGAQRRLLVHLTQADRAGAAHHVAAPIDGHLHQQTMQPIACRSSLSGK